MQSRRVCEARLLIVSCISCFERPNLADAEEPPSRRHLTRDTNGVSDQSGEQCSRHQTLSAEVFEIRLITVLPRTSSGADIFCRLAHVLFPLSKRMVKHEEVSPSQLFERACTPREPRYDLNDASTANNAFGKRPRLEYVALSYTRGSAQDRKLIYVNDQSSCIRNNLYDFLADWSLLPENLQTGPFWMDQTNIAGRGHQVSHMSHIYKLAS